MGGVREVQVTQGYQSGSKVAGIFDSGGVRFQINRHVHLPAWSRGAAVPAHDHFVAIRQCDGTDFAAIGAVLRAVAFDNHVVARLKGSAQPAVAS